MDGGDYAEDVRHGAARARRTARPSTTSARVCSSLSLPRSSFPVDVLKIDRSFVGSARGPTARQRAIVDGDPGDGARVAGCTVVAEGVETQAQLDDLRALAPADLSCHAQGFLFARPTIAAEYVLAARDADMLIAC